MGCLLTCLLQVSAGDVVPRAGIRGVVSPWGEEEHGGGFLAFDGFSGPQNHPTISWQMTWVRACHSTTSLAPCFLIGDGGILDVVVERRENPSVCVDCLMMSAVEK